jgi:hypothetical protein
LSYHPYSRDGGSQNAELTKVALANIPKIIIAENLRMIFLPLVSAARSEVVEI